MKYFEDAFAILLEQEGGYSDDPEDSGGKTRYGITEAVARENGYLGDMRDLPLDVARAIYKLRYWEAVGCDYYPWPLSLYVFDCAVNQGVEPAKKMLQRALDTVQDGVIGPTTRRLAAQSSAWHWGRFMAFRAMRYVSTRGFDRFGAGWLTRMFQVARQGAL